MLFSGDGKKVVLLTDDKNLRNKCMFAGVTNFSSKGLGPLLTDVDAMSASAEPGWCFH
jgi:hypothetical protein